MANNDGYDTNRVAVIVAGILLLVAAAFMARSWVAAPQMGTDEEVFTTVDALFTAMTTRDKKRLEDCSQRLTTYRKEGKIPVSAANNLDGMIKTAESGQWEASARQLYKFMMAQRRQAS